jgi:hypothetical protein
MPGVGAMTRSEDILVLLLLLALAGLLVWLLARSIADWLRHKREMSDERASRIGRPIPHAIRLDISRAHVGNFDGEELTPLSYLGYHTGRTKGLLADARRQRLKVCFETELSDLLHAKYKRRWGRPVTYQRYASIINHLAMLANQRRWRSNYKFAVSDWDADAEWMKAEFGQLARDLRTYGFRR